VLCTTNNSQPALKGRAAETGEALALMPNLEGSSVHLPIMSQTIFPKFQGMLSIARHHKHYHLQGDVRATRLLTSAAQHYFDLAITEMDTFKFNGHCLDNELVAMIAQLLDNARIPNVLWGNYLLTIYGVPSVVDVSLRVAKFCMV
jgi:hypothetical protein